MTTTEFQEWAHARQLHMEAVLERLLPGHEIAPARLHQAMRYAVLGGGKRIRPLLAFAAGEMNNADPARVEIVAAAAELIHAYSLVHDDLPCMDDDTLRRGKPTCHVEFGEAMALLAGDSLQALAFQLLAEHHLSENAAAQLEMLKLLAAAAGSRGMAGGQAIDLEAVGKQLSVAKLEFMHIHKTGALIRAAILLGAHCGKPMDSRHTARLDHFAKCIGLAFQVVDDVLDAEANTATLGKTAGKDAQQNKPTYVTVLGIEQARAFAAELRTDALAALEIFGERAQGLRELADFIISREF